MITLQEGSKENPPFVEVEITPGRWPFEWWYEVSYWDADNETDGEKQPCWVHYWQKDGGGFGLWFVMKKASIVMNEVWGELWDEYIDKKLPPL